MLVQFLPRPRDANSFDDMQALDAITALPSFRLDFKSAWRWKPTSKIGS
jgi:hypothetical protein